MYTFSKPRYETYPYSQHDIPPTPEYQQHQHHLHYLRHYPTALVDSDPNYYSQQAHSAHTSVEIQPSHSYEIKQTEHGYKTIFHGNDEHSPSAYSHGNSEAPSSEAVPIIVLRVPGPTKYAAHLQALLQQYVEARAAQYIQAFQQQEAHGIDSSQQIGHGHVPDISAFGGLPMLPYGPHQAYLPSQMYFQPINQIQPYFGQHALSNPYASAHIAQPIEIDDDQSVANPSPANYYPTHEQSQTSDESDHHTGKMMTADRLTTTENNRNWKYPIRNVLYVIDIWIE